MEVADNRRVFDFLEETGASRCTTGRMILQVVLDDDKGLGKSDAQASHKLPSVSHKVSFPPAFRLDIASRSVRMSRHRRRCRIRQNKSDRYDQLIQKPTCQVNNQSSQSAENSINKPTIQVLTNKVNTFDTAVEGLSAQRTEEESVASDLLSKATADPVLLPVQGIGAQKVYAHRGPSTIRRFFRRGRLRKRRTGCP